MAIQVERLKELTEPPLEQRLFKPVWEKVKPYAGWVAMFGIPLAASFVFKRRLKINNPDIEAQVADFRSSFERQLLTERVGKLKKDYPEMSKVYTKELRSLRRKGISKDDAVRQTIETVENQIGKKIEIKTLPVDQYFYNNLDGALERWIMGDPRELLYIAEKEFLPKIGRKGVPARWWHPQAVLREEIPGTQLYNLTNELRTEINSFLRTLLERRKRLTKDYKLNKKTQEEIDQFIFYHENKSRLTPEEVTRFPDWMKELSERYRKEITDPIWEMAAKYDPNVRYRKDYLTHFIVDDHVRNLREELARLIAFSKEGLPTPLANSVDTEIQVIKRLLSQAEVQKQALDVLKARAYGRKGYFGPLEHARVANAPYIKNFEEITDRYIYGATRKIFLDRLLPEARRLTALMKSPHLKEYAFDYIQAQKGNYGYLGKVRLGEALQLLWRRIPGQEKFADSLRPSHVDRAMNFLTSMNYLLKLGLSWIKWPLVNLPQTILTLYPLVRERALMHGYKMAFTKEGWELARKYGATEGTFEAVTEILAGKPYTLVRALSLPGGLSESYNRVVSFNAGLFRGRHLGLKGSQLIRFAKGVVDNSQWVYGTPARPVVSTTPLGRAIWQFKIFTMNYMKYLSDLQKIDPPAFSRAIASLLFLTGTGVVPFYKHIQDTAIKYTGIILPDENLTIAVSDTMWGARPVVDLGASLNPFFVPWDPLDWAGPTIAPALRLSHSLLAGDIKRFKKEVVKVSPPIKQMYLGIAEPEVKTIAKRPRVLGIRAPLEVVGLVRGFEYRRRRYMDKIQAAMEAGRHDIVRQLRKDAKEEGIFITQKDIATIKARITMKKLEEEQ